MQLIGRMDVESKSSLRVGSGARFLLHALVQTQKNYFVAGGRKTEGLIAGYACNRVCRQRCHRITNKKTKGQVDLHDFAPISSTKKSTASLTSASHSVADSLDVVIG